MFTNRTVTIHLTHFRAHIHKYTNPAHTFRKTYFPFVTSPCRNAYAYNEYAQPAKSTKPANKLNDQQEDRDFVTESKSHFAAQQWNAPPQVSCVLYRPSPIPYKACSTTHNSTRHLPCLPNNSHHLFLSSQPMKRAAHPADVLPSASSYDASALQTEASRFQNYGQVARVASFKPNLQYAPNQDDREWETTASAVGNNGNRPGKQPSYKPQNVTYQPVQFSGTTTAAQDFQGYSNVARRAPFKPVAQMEQQHEDREFTTEAQQNFARHGFAQAKSCAPVRKAPDSVPFEGRSTAQADFGYVKGAPAPSAKPPAVVMTSSEDRTFQTEASQGFGRTSAQARVLPCKPAPSQNLFQGHLESETSNRAAFRYQQQPPPASFKPQRQYEKVADDRDWGTEMSGTFSAKPSNYVRAKPEQRANVYMTQHNVIHNSGQSIVNN
jgi:hypothetical protein